LNYNEWWSLCGKYYQRNYNITSEEFKEFDYSNGLNIGDVMVLYGKDYEDIEIGEILVFIPEDKTFFEQKGPVIHRVVDKWEDEKGNYHFQTKGDHNSQSFPHFERNISQEDVIGVAVVRVPFIGYAKIIIVEIFTGVLSIF
jgi:signal peptidase I